MGEKHGKMVLHAKKDWRKKYIKKSCYHLIVLRVVIG